jgi:hypothetical protein
VPPAKIRRQNHAILLPMQLTARRELNLIQIHNLGPLRTLSSGWLQINGQATRARSAGSVRAPRIAWLT